MTTLAVAGCSDDDFTVKPIYNHANGRVQVQLVNRDLESEETLFVRSRRGTFGTLDCADIAKPEFQVAGGGTLIDGPYVDATLTKAFYGPEWASEPTPEMLASLELGTDSIIDVCVMNGSEVVRRVERDLFAAWDEGRKQGLGGKADDPASGEVKINSPEAYGERCVAELGEIPFFDKLADGSYSTYNCLESTAIPMTVTKADGSMDAPQEGTVDQCDNPQYIYSLCEAGPRVASRINEQGTRWVLLCRKSKGGFGSDQYNDIAMIGSNPFTGKTCFFQNALYSKTDGGKVPHPSDTEKSKTLWSGVHGGLGSGIQCASCHDADPFIHTPWIDGAKDANGRTVIPKMGVDPDYPLGANDMPYSLVNMGGQNWKMEKQLVSVEANACLKCHRMGGGRWAESWIDRLGGTDTSWKNITTEKFNTSAHKYWMPPETAFADESDWTGSEFKSALDFIANCGKNPMAAGCIWKDVPTTAGGEGGGSGLLRNPVDGTDDQIANKATAILGMNKNAPSQQCAECHAPNQTTLRDWQEKTDTALGNCLAPQGAGEVKEDKFENQGFAPNAFKVYGPFDVAAGAHLDVTMTGTGDADLYVKRGAVVTDEIYDCRPYAADTSNESCGAAQFNAAGPAMFWVAVKGTVQATVNVSVKYTAPGASMMPAKEIVDCMRLDPSRADSPFAPTKVGIYSAASHLGWFQNTFKAAYPIGGAITADTWAFEYGKFKNRTSMPKGNHPRFTQEEFDVVAEWFARGLPRLTTYIAADNGPTSCTPSISSTMSTHASTMATQGWGALNREAGMNMYGCGSATNPLECLTSLPEAQTKPYGTDWAASGKLRVLRELAFNTYYWMRSSADGRFVGNGSTGGDGGVMSDLQTNKDIGVQAAYDPGFFPDGKGWVFQGTPIGAGFCSTSLLTSNPDRIDFSEPACSSVESVSLYQHLGAGLGGGDYMVINSQFTSDNPSGTVTQDPSAGFAQSAQMKFTPMVFDGTHYTGKPPVSINSPFEGDSVLSPSTKLVISRFGNEGTQLGFVVRKLTATSNGPSYDITSQEVGRYCVQGAKAAISFDEKFMVTHHYVGPNDYADLGYASANDAGFQAILNAGSANIIVVNLVTGVRTRVTTMKAGQYALFPHFRSDGWIYFLVRDKSSGKEYAVGSDAILRL